MRKLLASSVTSVSLVALSVALTPSYAMAQTAPTTPPGTPQSSTQDDDPTAAPQEDQDTQASAAESAAPLDTGSGENTIVVTGSRIARPEFSAPNPVQSYSSETIEQSGQTNLTDFLQNSPQLLSSADNQDAAGSNLPQAQFAGVNLLNLRSLGPQRTLVLVDGRRHIAGIYGTAQVDINTIPVDLIDRIDILTGGTSAVYGADGVSGVVNFVMKKDFEGLSIRGQSAISQRGDGGNRFVAATYGKNFSDGRGNISVAYEFNELDRFRQIQRLGYGRSGPTTTIIRNPADPDSRNDNPNIVDNIPSDEHPLGGDLRWIATSPGSAVNLDLDYYPDFTGEGTVYDRGTPVRGTAFTIGGDSTSREIYYGDFTPYSRRHNFNALFNFEFSPKFRLFAEGKYVNIKALTDGQPSYDFFTFIAPDNAYLNQVLGPEVQDLRDTCAADPEDEEEYLFCSGGEYLGAVISGRDNLDFGLRRASNKRSTYRGVLGADGKLSDHLKYELSLTYGRTDAKTRNENDRYTDRYFAAIDTVVNPANGQITCRINLPGETTILASSSQPGAGGSLDPVTFQPGQCVPLNIFGYGSPSQEALDWVLTDHGDQAHLRQLVASGYLSGDSGAFFNLPGGPVGFAIGAEYRKEKSKFTPDQIEQQGLLGDFGQSSAASGEFDVKEVFGELNVPILKDSPIAHSLDVGGAIRFSDYSSIGNTTSWSVNGTYAPVRDISFRGTYSQSVRAPNIAELYSARTTSFAFIADPCGVDNINSGSQFRVANCTAALTALGINPAAYNPARNQASPQNSSIPGFFSGYDQLDEETAKTFTAGVVLRPRFVSGFQVAFDWYDIKLGKAISTPTATQLVGLCYDQPTLDNIYCANVGRAATTGFVNYFYVYPQNVSKYRTSGLDMALNYRFNAPWKDGGIFNLKVNANYLHRLEFIATPGADVDVDRDEADLATGAFAGGGPFPRYSASGDLTWTKGAFTMNYGINWFWKTRRYTTEQMESHPDRIDPKYVWYKPYIEHQVQVAYDVEKRMNVYFGINNLWDEKPDVGVTGYPVPATGRYFYAGVKLRPF